MALDALSRVASPEKALVDSFHLSSRRGKRFGSFPELDLGGTFATEASYPARG